MIYYKNDQEAKKMSLVVSVVTVKAEEKRKEFLIDGVPKSAENMK